MIDIDIKNTLLVSLALNVALVVMVISYWQSELNRPLLKRNGNDLISEQTGSQPHFSRSNAFAIVGNSIYTTNADGNVVLKISASSGAVSVFAGTSGTSGCTDATGVSALFNHPSGIATDGVYLYVADTDNHTIRKIFLKSRKVRTFAGTPSLSGLVDGRGTNARFNRPTQLTTEGNTLYVFDSGNNVYRKIDITNGVVTTIREPEAVGSGFLAVNNIEAIKRLSE